MPIVAADKNSDGTPGSKLIATIKSRNGKFIRFVRDYYSESTYFIGYKKRVDGEWFYVWISKQQYLDNHDEYPEDYPICDGHSVIPFPSNVEYIGTFTSHHNTDEWMREIADIEHKPELVYAEVRFYNEYAEYEVSKKVGADDEMVISASQQYKQAGNSIVVDVLAKIYHQLWYPHPIEKVEFSLFDDLFPEDALPDLPPEAAKSAEKVLLTTFSGYDSQAMAMDVLKEQHPDFRWTWAGWSDIDKYACQMHNLVFPEAEDKALGDITKIDWHKVKESLQGREVDLFTYSSPCQDISQAGRQAGLKEGSDTRSALLWRVADAVEVLRPKYLLQENVAALVSEKFLPDFQKWLDRLESLGYVNRWARLNAKDYGVPQNRDRVFCLSMRRDCAFDYHFPEPEPLTRKLEDVLEEEVDEKYFLKDDAVSKFLVANNKDTAVFTQFSAPPTHEDAMFIKTWLSRWMEANDGWQMQPEQLQAAVEDAKSRLFPSDWRTSPEMADEGFLSEYYTNLNKHRDAS